MKIPDYPDFKEITLDDKGEVESHLREGRKISEFTFANLYLFREVHHYALSRINGFLVVSGMDSEKNGEYFMLPSGLPGEGALSELFRRFFYMKNADEAQAAALEKLGFAISEDRDNFDYVYRREELSKLAGRKYHTKKNLVNFFVYNYSHGTEPLAIDNIDAALTVLEAWEKERAGERDDYHAAKEALGLLDKLGLCGTAYFVDKKPAGFIVGEELDKDTFAIHFEKSAGKSKGLVQFMNKEFCSTLPQKYLFVNMEQDLGKPGLKKYKLGYKPDRFVKKFLARRV